MTDVGEVEHRRQTEELVAPLSYDSATTGNDDLWEMIVKRYVVIAKGHRGVAVKNERR